MVDALQEKNILSGYPDKTFKPNKTINRAEALKIIFKGAAIREGEESTGPSIKPFPDVAPTAWFSSYVRLGKSKNIIQGYPDGTFRPDSPVNRVEFIKMTVTALPFFQRIARAAGSSEWYSPYVEAAYALDLLSRDSALNPSDPMLRGDAGEIIYRLVKYLEENPGSKKKNFIPEQSFAVLEPGSESELSGPASFLVRYDGKTTQVSDIEGAFELSLPGKKYVTTFPLEPFRVNIAFSSSCSVDIDHIDRGDFTSYEYFLELEKGLTETPLSRIHNRIRDYDGIDLYTITQSFTDGTLEEIWYGMGKNSILEFSSSCPDVLPEVFSHIRLP